MTAKRPRCVHCGAAYGQRWAEHVEVRWDAPVKVATVKAEDGERSG